MVYNIKRIKSLSKAVLYFSYGMIPVHFILISRFGFHWFSTSDIFGSLGAFLGLIILLYNPFSLIKKINRSTDEVAIEKPKEKRKYYFFLLSIIFPIGLSHYALVYVTVFSPENLTVLIYIWMFWMSVDYDLLEAKEG